MKAKEGLFTPSVVEGWKLSPSDFAYLPACEQRADKYEDRKLCYCLKIKHGISLPSMPMPGVF